MMINQQRNSLPVLNIKDKPLVSKEAAIRQLNFEAGMGLMIQLAPKNEFINCFKPTPLKKRKGEKGATVIKS